MVLLGALLERAIGFQHDVTTREAAAQPQQPKHVVDLLTILSLAVSSISIIATLTTLYWFLKMRRSFRHELIMLLIQSDFVKSVAFFVFPIVTLIRGPVESSSPFCQLSGFALAVGIESADIAVLLIAVHSVMYIFRPRSGLYPYRRTAYMIYYLFPLAMGCLAFVDGSGYRNVGHYCYLRTDNGWARMALSWVPRYIIGISIVFIYAFVYLYVRKRMGDYGRRSSTTMPYPPSPGYRDSEVPPTPPIAYHGLLSSAPNSRRGSAADSIVKGQNRGSLSSVSTLRLEHAPNSGTGGEQGTKSTSRPSRAVHWNNNWSGFSFDKQPGTSSAALFEDDEQDPLAPGRPSISSPLPVHSPANLHHRQSISQDPSDTLPAARYPAGRRGSLSTPAVGDRSFMSDKRARHVSFPTLIPLEDRRGSTSSATNLEHRLSLPSTEHTESTTASSTTATSSTLTAKNDVQPTIALPSPPLLPPHRQASPDLVATDTFGGDDYAGVTKNREKIRRQLRSLIVYPLAYMFIWVFPFVSHVMGYDDTLNPADPKWLLVVSFISLCIQGTVDSLLFAIREQPWRYARGKFWTAVGNRLGSYVNFWARDAGWGWRWRGDGVRGGAAGRTREEMLVDGRLARERRQEEIMFERARAGRIAGSGGMGGGYFSGAWNANVMKGWTRVPRGRGSVDVIGMPAAVKTRREWWDVDPLDGAMSDEDEDMRIRRGDDDVEGFAALGYRDCDGNTSPSSGTQSEGEGRRVSQPAG
ncbi:G protein-coupled glucose receptor regulating Gpa2-domain-containing protein [Rhypophila decipiens]|uniref:G protein-coupled glucose receptor regulating Gpa2-domain-containing protein n=1 Tax=Rhypophila decipiens TaxID=261697 RepID=A0AAN6Y7D3_9PEZI|nr:G protein-coupled glucose receptor regulating Gpa2-domain-containing protein [Rhypophila decipiens]